MRRRILFSLFTFLLLGGWAAALISLPAAALPKGDTSNGQILVVLSNAPNSPATVKATRDKQVPQTATGAYGKAYGPETVSLGLDSGGGSKSSQQSYTSPILAFSGNSTNTSCETSGNSNADYYSWTIKVSGTATGSGQVTIGCGGLQTVNITDTVTKSGGGSGGSGANGTGTITGTVTADDGSVCGGTSTYMLVKPGGDINFQSNPGTPLPIDGSGNYTISSVKPGTYDLGIDCLYTDGGSSTIQEQVITLSNVAVVQGKTANASQAANASQHSGNPTCDTGGFGINWILCPVFNTVAGISGWLFTSVVQPFLRTTPISTSPSDPSYQIWSNFRIYGDIFLVIALLVVVFGQSIGGGLIDAYTAKKVLPRLLAAAILINLSIYIVAALVDITNILGGGIGELMTAPLKNAGAFNISPSGVQGLEVLGISGGALVAGLGAGLLGLFVSIPAIANLAAFIGLFVLMPVVFGLLAAFITLVLRKAIILALVLVSPVAFALYCLPNTEKYFRKWWDFLIQTLAVYPIVVMFFAVADILSVTIMKANGKSNALAPIIAFVMQFLPLLFIPYAFRLAGGAVGKLHEVITDYHKRGQEGIKGNVNDPWSRRNMAKRGVSNSMLMGRERLINNANNRQMKGGRYGLLARGAGFSRNDVLRSRLNKESAELSQGLVGTGDDWRYRAAFARELRYKTGEDAAGNATYGTGWFNTQAKEDENGVWIPGTGSQFSAEQVAQSKRFVRSDPSHYQAGLTYELGNKAGDDDDVMRVLEAHDRNMAEMQVGEQDVPMWVGTVFASQAKYKDLKHTRVKKDPITGESVKDAQGRVVYQRSSRDHSREHAQTVGTYALSNMSERTVTALEDDYLNADAFLKLNDPKSTASDAEKQAARQTLDALGQKKVKIRPLRDVAEAKEVIGNVISTANSLNSRMLNNGTYALEGEGEAPVSGAQTGAPGKVQEAIDHLVDTAATNKRQQQPRQPRGRSGPEMGGGFGLGV